MRQLFNDIISRRKKISVIGLGYVGLPLAAAFAEKVEVIGFDTNKEKIGQYLRGVDPTREVGDERLKQIIGRSNLRFTSDESDLSESSFHIVAVPTPVNKDHTPDLSLVKKASAMLGGRLRAGSVVVYESTVYPGVTEEICLPILERESGMVCGRDFKIGYSPERINPGDRVHRLENITKIVSGMDDESLGVIADLYDLIILPKTYRVSSIKTAEAIKIAENSQRDINIAFMNELAFVFDRMGIDTIEVVNGMNTKWNALGFYPGLVGGHCIGVDPYYFVYQAERLGYHSQIILSGRQINDSAGAFIAEATVKQLIYANIRVREAKVAIMGVTFKENCPDSRNSKVIDIAQKLNEYGVDPRIYDPLADPGEVMNEYGLELTRWEDIHDMDCLVFAVGHEEFRRLDAGVINTLFSEKNNYEKVVIDVRGVLEREAMIRSGFRYWRL